MDNYIYIDQGANFYQIIETGKNLTGFSINAQIRKWYDDNEYEFFNCIVLDATTGQIAISMTATGTIFLKPGRNVYDILATSSSGDRIRIGQGQAIVSPGLTGVNPTNSVQEDDMELLEIIQGSDFKYVVELRDVNGSLKDLTGYTGRMQIRPIPNSPVLIMELNDENGRISIDPSFGTVTINLTAAETSTLSFDVAVYDLEITAPDTKVTRILGGKVILILNITK